jgi:hypothetical protein
MTMKCLAVPKTTIKQCRNIAYNDTKLCQLHGKFKEKENTIQLYNGSIYTFTETFKDIISFTKPIFLWQEFNRELAKSNQKGFSKSAKRKLDEQAKLIKCGSQNKIIDYFISDGNFKSTEDVLNFNWIPENKKSKNSKLNVKKFNKKTFDSARHFLGVIFYFNRKIEKLKKIQVNIRIKLKYGKHIYTIIKLQKWIRYRIWLTKLPITPLRLRKQFIPNINKIILLQKVFKKYINIKVKHSHNCPFSLEDYCDIPNKYRVVYKYKAGGNYHWRYYDIRWLHMDFLSQTSDKRFVIEPTTKQEFPIEFVEEIARKSWYLTRIENDYLNINVNNLNIPQYVVEDDWMHRFKRRSLYRFSLMLLDLFDKIGLTTDKINIWRNAEFKLKYQIFYLKVMPELKSIASNIYLTHIEEDIFYITQDMFRIEFILPDSINYEELAGDAIYGILRIIMSSQRCNPDIYDIIKDIIKENIQTLLMN